ncbi:MAG: type II toxin-antitoxin system VapC family toxin [Rickettsiaceae bacterium]|nr:type II toxin-antitoxin system VapC family toxin [Rickettsiaceae bacterium]
MNRYLIDTCVFLWALNGDTDKLGKFIPIIENSNNIIFVSIASYWEIIIKKSLGRIDVRENLAIATQESGFIWLDIKLHHIDYIEKLPNLHKDPFDRLIISQAQTEDLRFLTDDKDLMEYVNILNKGSI